jgi:hypothetical protein
MREIRIMALHIEIPFRSTIIVDTTPSISPLTSRRKRKRAQTLALDKVL